MGKQVISSPLPWDVYNYLDEKRQGETFTSSKGEEKTGVTMSMMVAQIILKWYAQETNTEALQVKPWGGDRTNLGDNPPSR